MSEPPNNSPLGRSSRCAAGRSYLRRNTETSQPRARYFKPGRISWTSFSNRIEIPFVTMICLR